MADALASLAPTEDETKQMEESVEEQPTEEAPKDEKTDSPEPIKQDAPVESAPEQEKPVEQKKSESVPFAAFHAKNEELKLAKQQLAALEEVKRQLAEFNNKKKETTIPQYEEDPLGNLDHRIKTEVEKQAEISEKIKQFEEFQQRQALAQHVTTLEAQFRRTTPDYDKALEYVLDVRKSELEMLGITDPEVINREIIDNANNISRAALSQGKNPAEFIYGMAKRYGYKKEPEKLVTPPQQKLAAVQNGQEKAGKTLSKGGDVEKKLNAEDFAREKFNINDPNFEAKWKELFGE